MSISMRSSALAIVPETTEGVPVAPTAATQYMALQDGFSIKPDFNVNENAELTPSIGKRKSILGSEKPTASFSHYLKHSGVEGQAPEWAAILEGAFGEKVTAGTEYDTTTGSTVSKLVFPSGEGAHFQRGQGVLIKDPTNGYSVRVIDNMSTDDANLSFDLANAPATGVNTGKCVMFKPVQSGHKSYSLWNYLGNGGAVELMAGTKVTSLSVQAQAGSLINASISLAGVAFYLNPIEITSSTKTIDFTDDDSTYAASVTAGMYKDPKELADALATAMNAVATQTYTVTYDDATGKFSIVGTGTLLSLLWNTGDNTAASIAPKLGFSTSADSTSTGATTGYTSTTAIALAAPQTGTLDSSDPVAAKGAEVFIGDSTDNAVFEASDVTFALTNTRVENKSVCAASGVSGSTITAREVKITVKALLDKYDVSKFTRFRENTTTRFQATFGPKSGGSWAAGKTAYMYAPSASITSFNIASDNDQASLELELSVFVDSAGDGEAYLGFL